MATKSIPLAAPGCNVPALPIRDTNAIMADLRAEFEAAYAELRRAA